MNRLPVRLWPGLKVPDKGASDREASIDARGVACCGCCCCTGGADAGTLPLRSSRLRSRLWSDDDMWPVICRWWCEEEGVCLAEPETRSLMDRETWGPARVGEEGIEPADIWMLMRGLEQCLCSSVVPRLGCVCSRRLAKVKSYESRCGSRTDCHMPKEARAGMERAGWTPAQFKPGWERASLRAATSFQKAQRVCFLSK